MTTARDNDDNDNRCEKRSCSQLKLRWWLCERALTHDHVYAPSCSAMKGEYSTLAPSLY